MGRANAANRAKARQLRTDGLGYQEIADRCKVVVSTAWRWTGDIAVMTADQHDGRMRR